MTSKTLQIRAAKCALDTIRGLLWTDKAGYIYVSCL